MTSEILRRFVEQVLVNEAARTFQDAVSTGIGLVEAEVDDGLLTVLLRELDGEVRVVGAMLTTRPVHGHMRQGPVKFVKRSAAEHRFGPLLYDIVMNDGSGGWLACDRRDVSDEAAAVWEYYYEERPDVIYAELKRYVGDYPDQSWREVAFRLKSPVDKSLLKGREWIDEELAVELGLEYVYSRT